MARGSTAGSRVRRHRSHGHRHQSRRVLPADLAGRAFTLDLFKQAGLAPRIDAAGNIIGRLEGSDASLKPILIGSHVDSVTDGGNFDGPVGSFGAIEVARTLREQGVRLRHPLDVVVWQNEEGGTIGSKLAIGELTDADLDKVARSGKTIREGIGLVGGDVTRLRDAVKKPGDIACYIELHIEQGGLLEKAGLQIGVVQGIVGLRWFEVTITGFANHAGATPMDQRQDAMLAAAKFTVAVNEAITRRARTSGGHGGAAQCHAEHHQRDSGAGGAHGRPARSRSVPSSARFAAALRTTRGRDRRGNRHHVRLQAAGGQRARARQRAGDGLDRVERGVHSVSRASACPAAPDTTRRRSHTLRRWA